MSSTVRHAIVGAGVLVIATAGVAAAVASLGLAPVAADASPSGLEARLMPAVLRAAIARRAASEVAPEIHDGGGAPSAEDLAAGAEIYDGACARCHGKIGGGASALGAAFYPPAPPLPGHRTRFSRAELFTLVKHGVRMTGMPAWGGLLSDRDIARVAAVVARFGD